MLGQVPSHLLGSDAFQEKVPPLYKLQGHPCNLVKI